MNNLGRDDCRTKRGSDFFCPYGLLNVKKDYPPPPCRGRKDSAWYSPSHPSGGLRPSQEIPGRILKEVSNALLSVRKGLDFFIA